MSSGVISGAITSQYLLEKSRIVFQVTHTHTCKLTWYHIFLFFFSIFESVNLVCHCQAKDERNYHIFYEMLAGLPSQQKQAFYLQEAETYYYLNQVEGMNLQEWGVGTDHIWERSVYVPCPNREETAWLQERMTQMTSCVCLLPWRSSTSALRTSRPSLVFFLPSCTWATFTSRDMR